MRTLGKLPSSRFQRKSVELGHAIILVFALAFGGCAAFSQGGMSAEGSRFRHALRQGRQSGKGMTIYAICPEEFPQGGRFAAIRDSRPSSEGAQLLRDQVLTDIMIAKAVNDLGLPTAVGFTSSAAGQVQHFAMFYRTPPRSLVLKRSSMSVKWLSLSQLYKSRVIADIPAVPRSVRYLAFHERSFAPPWPVTIPPDLHEAFAVPPQPAAPSTEVDGHDYVVVANDLAGLLLLSVNVQNRRRAEAALAKLEPAARVEGLHWRVVVVNMAGPMGFGVPDGTLFVSDRLVEGLEDAELAAVIAHLMGHEWYQHGRRAARSRNILDASVRLFVVVGGALQIARGGVGFFPELRTGGYLEVIADPLFGYTQADEVEANAAASRILDGANLGPEALFDAMVKLSGSGQPGTLAFDVLHHLSAAAIFKYGLMLDAGLGIKQP